MMTVRLRLRPLAAALLLLIAAAPAAATDLVREGTARVTAVVDGDTLALDDGSEVRLVGLQAPKLPLGRPGFRAWPLAEEARLALAALTDGAIVELAYGGTRRDRHGRRLAHVHLPERGDLWVQGELLRRGMARVYSFADNRALVPEMLAIERQARKARRGIWALDYYAVRGAAEAGTFTGGFQIIEGTVLEAAVVRGRGYLNFGADWRTDFTIALPPEAMRLFRADGIDIETYRNRPVRVRGWLRERNGPEIEASHPEQIELLER